MPKVDPFVAMQKAAKRTARLNPAGTRWEQAKHSAKRAAILSGPSATRQVVGTTGGFAVGMGVALAFGAGAAGAAASAGISVGIGFAIAAGIATASLAVSEGRRIYSATKAEGDLSAEQLRKLITRSTLRNMTAAHHVGLSIARDLERQFRHIENSQAPCPDWVEATASLFRIKGVRAWLNDREAEKYRRRLVALRNLLLREAAAALDFAEQTAKSSAQTALKWKQKDMWEVFHPKGETCKCRVMLPLEDHGRFTWTAHKGEQDLRVLSHLILEASKRGDRGAIYDRLDSADRVLRAIAPSSLFDPAAAAAMVQGAVLDQVVDTLSSIADAPLSGVSVGTSVVSGGAGGAAPASAGAGLAAGLAAEGAGRLVDMWEMHEIRKKLAKALQPLRTTASTMEIKPWVRRLFWTDMALQKVMGDMTASIPRLAELKKYATSPKPVYKDLSFYTRSEHGKEVDLVIDNLSNAYELQRLAIGCVSLPALIMMYLEAEAALEACWKEFDRLHTSNVNWSGPTAMGTPARHRGCGIWCLRS